MEKASAPDLYKLRLNELISFNLMRSWTADNTWPFLITGTSNFATKWFKLELQKNPGMTVETLSKVSLVMFESYKGYIDLYLDPNEAMMLKLTHTECFV